MKHTASQTVLRIMSILEFLSGIVFASLLIVFFLGMNDKQIASSITTSKAELFFDITKLFINTVLLFISWHIYKKVAKDASRHNDALTITMAVIAFEIFNFITSLGKGVPRNLVAMIVSVVINLIALIFISNVRKSYEEYMKNNRDDN